MNINYFLYGLIFGYQSEHVVYKLSYFTMIQYIQCNIS